MAHYEGVLKFAAPHDDLIKAIDSIEADGQTEYIDEVSKRIRRYLRFQQLGHLGRQRGFTPHDIAETKSTNCFGFSIITSEFLSLKGINNAILWANLHALVAATGENGAAWFLHSDMSQLNSPVTPRMAMVSRPGGGLLRDWLNNEEQQRTSLVLNTEEILRAKGRKLGEQRVENLPWLSFLDYTRELRSYSERRISQGNLIMATLTRDLTGRRMLENMANFQLAILRQQNETATSSLLGMAGVWPEVDRRDLGDNSYFLNGYLQRRGKAGDDTFLDQVDVVADSATGFSDDIRVRLWKPDLLRRVAIQTGDVDMLDLAIGGYEAVRAGSRYSELVEGKLRKATAQRNRLAKIS